MPSFLLTGASGFIGTALAARLVGEGHEVRAVVRAPARAPEGTSPLQVDDVAGAVEWGPRVEGVQVVIHAAGRAHLLRDRSADPLGEFRRVNRDATLRLAEASARAGVRRFVYLSSVGVLGESTAPGAPWTAASPVAPVAPYAVSKWEAEQGLAELAARTALEVVVIRPPLVHGPGAPGNFRRLLDAVAAGWPLPLAGIENRRTFVGRQNLVEFIVAAAEAPGATGVPLLPTDPGSVSTPELVRLMGEGLGRPARLFRLPGLHLAGRLPGIGGAVRKLTGSLEIDGRASWALVGRRPLIGLREGILEMSSPRPRRGTP